MYKGCYVWPLRSKGSLFFKSTPVKAKYKLVCVSNNQKLIYIENKEGI